MENMGMAGVLTSPAGSCITTHDWENAGVRFGVCYLDALLVKPGLDVLLSFENLPSYLGDARFLILNAHRLVRNVAGLFEVRSQYDGQKRTYSFEDIFSLILKLSPRMVILPREDWPLFEALPMQLFIPSTAFSNPLKHGVYFEEITESNLKAHKQRYPKMPCYVFGDVDIALIEQCFEWGADIVETDRPASDGYHGIAYGDEGALLISESRFTLDFSTLIKGCGCHTCSSALSRAYLHHIWHHVPLLCQRLLIQHNLYIMSRVNKGGKYEFFDE